MIALCLLIWGGSSLYSHFTTSSTNVAEPKQTITIAGKMGSEPAILINMYKELIEKNDPNTKVVLKPNFGGTTFLFKALQADKIDIYPEFTGTVLQTLVKTGKKTGNDPNQVYAEARSDLKSQFDMEYLKPMTYQNGYAFSYNSEVCKR